MDADLGDEMEKCRGEEEYEYPYSDSDEAPEVSPGQVCSSVAMLSFPPPLPVSVGAWASKSVLKLFHTAVVSPKPLIAFSQECTIGYLLAYLLLAIEEPFYGTSSSSCSCQSGSLCAHVRRLSATFIVCARISPIYFLPSPKSTPRLALGVMTC